MKTTELLERLKYNGCKICLKTLQRYRKSGLLPEPKIISMGRGGGKYADWPDNVVDKIIEIHQLKNQKVEISKLIQQAKYACIDACCNCRYYNRKLPIPIKPPECEACHVAKLREMISNA